MCKDWNSERVPVAWRCGGHSPDPHPAPWGSWGEWDGQTRAPYGGLGTLPTCQWLPKTTIGHGSNLHITEAKGKQFKLFKVFHGGIVFDFFMRIYTSPPPHPQKLLLQKIGNYMKDTTKSNRELILTCRLFISRRYQANSSTMGSVSLSGNRPRISFMSWHNQQTLYM